MKKEAEDRNVHRMAKVHHFLEMWQGSQNLCATQKDSHAQNKQMSAVEYILDTEEIVKISWSLILPDGAAAFELSERSPLPPALAAKDLPGGRTQILNVRRWRRIIRHPVETDEDSTPGITLHTANWLDWVRDIDDWKDSANDCAADIESDCKPDNVIKDQECPERRDVSATTHVPRLVRPTRKSKRESEMVMVTVNAIEMTRNKGIKQKWDRMRQCFTSFFV